MRLAIEALARHSVERPRDIAIVDAEGNALSWHELAARVDTLRYVVLEHTAPQARVAVSVTSGWRFWVSVLATSSAGRMPCLLPCPLPGMIHDRIRRELGPDTLIVDDQFLADVTDLRSSTNHGPNSTLSAISTRDVPTDPLGAILLSSGTTGRSRFVVRSSDVIDRITSILIEEGLSARGDHVASFLPMAHAYGFEHAFLAPLVVGARVHALGRFSREKAASAIESGATTLPLVPITAQALAEDEYTYDMNRVRGTLRCVITAGTPLPAIVRTSFERRFGQQIIDLYGASELGTIWLDRGKGGRTVRGVEIRLLERGDREGEIAVRSECMLTGTIGSNGEFEPPTEDGFFATGDLGARGQNGTFRVTGRTKLVFDVGGLKVNPIEVEQALETHPAIARARIRPISMGSALQRVAADIELRSGHFEPTILELRTFLTPLVASHTIPRSIRVVDQLPKTESGKLLRDTPISGESIAPVTRRPKGLEERSTREQYTKGLFDETARGYDNSSGAAFMRSGRWYRRRMLIKSGLKPGAAHLDVGSGTGLCAALAQEIVGPTGRVVALDPRTGMLEVARRRGVRETIEGRAESLPFPDASFDIVSMSYMLRHIEDLMLAFREARRVLRPNGRIVIFEVTRPTTFGIRHAFDFSMYWVVPSVGVVASGRPSTFPMMQYWADTIVDAARPERIVEALDRSGFIGTRHLLELGVFSCYRGTAPIA